MSHDFTKAPFHLTAEDVAWVDERMSALTARQKVAQLFNVMSIGSTKDMEPQILAQEPGSICRMEVVSAQDEREFIERVNAKLAVPVLSTTDLEGSFTTPTDAHLSPNPMGFAAANDPELTQQAQAIMAKQAQDTGIHWSFTPCIDVNAAFRSTIVGTRSFGSEVAKVGAHGVAAVKGLQGAGQGATAKHFPGEGFDDRDQHLVTTANPLSLDDWEEAYGKNYRALIEAGVKAVMPGHIGFPAYMREVEGVDGAEAYRPATVNKALLQNLLREQLGFKGLIVSDASAMAGMTSWYASRADLVLDCLNAGCDQVLFCENLEDDINTVLDGVKAGKITQERVDEAVRRNLAFKASLGIHQPKPTEPNRDRAKEDALLQSVLEQSVTLVKDDRNHLPMTPEKYKRVLLVSKGVILPFSPKPIPLHLADMMRGAGFEVTVHEWGTPVDPQDYDLLLYAFAEETLLTRGHINLNWLEMTGQFEAAMVRHWHTKPTIMVSFGYPYYLYEAPMAPTYINAYAAHPGMQKITLDALMGKIPFKGVSPVDPYGGIDPAQGQRMA